MKIELLSLEAQDGLRRFTKAVHNDELTLDAAASTPEAWAWLVYQLRAAIDLPEWFPKGKWATIQQIEEYLQIEAVELLGDFSDRAGLIRRGRLR